MSEAVVEVKGLSKRYRKKVVLDQVDLTLYAGEIIGLVGPNGIGKSTLMKCLCTLERPDAGEIHIGGYSLKKEREKALSVSSSMIEGPALFEDVSGEGMIRLMGKLRGVDKKRVETILAWTGLNQDLKMVTRRYSVGMKQRIALGMALLNQPQFLQLDEPMNGLDPLAIVELRDELARMVAKYQTCLLVSSHQLDLIEKMCTRFLYIQKGKVLEVEKKTGLEEFFVSVYGKASHEKRPEL